MTIQLIADGTLFLRSYGDRFGVLSRRDGARVVLDGPEHVLAREIAGTLGVRGLRAVPGADPGAADDTRGAVLRSLGAIVRDLLGGPGRVTINDLLAGAGPFVQFAEQQRIPLLGLCETSYRCNLRCTHCYVLHEVSAPRPSSLEAEDIRAVIDAMAGMGVMNLSISGGEPTLDPQYRTYLTRAKDLGMYVVLKTNATAFGPARAEDYASDPAQETHVSLYGSTPETHERMTAVRGSFRSTVRGLRELARRGVRCKVNCTVWKDNTGELDEIRTLVGEMGHDLVLDAIIHGRLDGDRSPLSHRISPEVEEALVESGHLAEFHPSPCSAGQLKVKVDARGGVSTCELLPRSFGNVLEEPLDRIWRKRTLRDYGRRVVSLSLTAVGPASDGRRCCPGLNELETGDLAGELVTP